MNFFDETKGKIKAISQKAKKIKPFLTLALGAVATVAVLPSCQTPTRMNSWQQKTERGPNGEVITTYQSSSWNLKDVSSASRDFGRASEDFADAYYTILKARAKFR